MRSCNTVLAVFLLICVALPQEVKQKPATSQASVAAEEKLAAVLESKVQAEWDAFKNRDKKAYGDLLADDFVAIETDGEGARDKAHAISEIDRSALRKYTLFGFRLITFTPDAALISYENTMEFSPTWTQRLLRVWVTELWVKREGHWKVRYYQETRVK